jgi:tetracycline 7-halogenase / FADH2 O2-dependent halogenase
MSSKRLEDKTFDVAIIGSGLTGSMLGAILARRGASVLIVDNRIHPRGGSGESTTPRSLVALRVLAERYGVPEIKSLTTFENCSKIIGTSTGIKKHFGFLLHHEGRDQDPRETNQSTNGPLSDAPHLYRQHTDAYIFHAAIKYGCEARQGFRIEGVEADESGVTITGANAPFFKEKVAFRARCVVDTIGRNSPVAAAMEVAEESARFKHHSRSQWTHMSGVRTTDEVFTATNSRDKPPVPWHEGTVHHVFEGGWIWVIPFNNHAKSSSPLCSVGLTLDPRRHPKEEGVSPQEEFERQLARFPDIARQFDKARAVREWDVADEAQYSRSRVVGDRWYVIGESAGHVDPLFSRDLSDSAEIVNALAWRLLRAVKDDDFSAERFEYVERLQQGLLDFDDALVSAAFASFGDYDLWNAVFRIWAWGSGAGTFRMQDALTKFTSDQKDAHFLELEEVPYPGFCWPDHDGYKKLFEEMVARCEAFDRGQISGEEAARDLNELLAKADFVPHHLGFVEPDERFLHPTPRKIVKSMRWAAGNADPELKKLLAGNVRQAISARLRGRRIF